jgi:hypothetical protein
MKPSENQFYSYRQTTIYNDITLSLNVFLNPAYMLTLACDSSILVKVVPQLTCLFSVDWRPLLNPRYTYESQTHSDPLKVDTTIALAVRGVLDPEKIIRTLGGEYTGS